MVVISGLKGSVKVPLAPKHYFRDYFVSINNKKRGEPVEIGRGGIVAFSHNRNHGRADTTQAHSPCWGRLEFEAAFQEPCDEWVSEFVRTSKIIK